MCVVFPAIWVTKHRSGSSGSSVLAGVCDGDGVTHGMFYFSTLSANFDRSLMACFFFCGGMGFPRKKERSNFGCSFGLFSSTFPRDVVFFFWIFTRCPQWRGVISRRSFQVAVRLRPSGDSCWETSGKFVLATLGCAEDGDFLGDEIFPEKLPPLYPWVIGFLSLEIGGKNNLPRVK